MKSLRRCPFCQMVLPADSPKGLCPRCLLERAIALDEDSGPSDGDANRWPNPDQAGRGSGDAAELRVGGDAPDDGLLRRLYGSYCNKSG